MGQKTVNVIGAGLAGLAAAITLAEKGVKCNLISSFPSERAQSVLAEGGINAALDTMGEGDSVGEHFNDTMSGGRFIESERAVAALTANAPAIVEKLVRLGVPFNSENGRLILRGFGGQKKKRTAFAKSSTGKMIMTALIDEARRYEAAGLIDRFSHHSLAGIDTADGKLRSVTVLDGYTGRAYRITGSAVLCTGGLNGFFKGLTTGTSQNTGDAAALCFAAGARFADLEFIQYHPTTVPVSGKRLLISEAARGEGGRLFITRGGRPWYFMEEKYPSLGNLMPRDVVSREIEAALSSGECEGGVFLDMTGIPGEVWEKRLSDMRGEIISYLGTDPASSPVPIIPGIHFFMGGVRVNARHESSVESLFAAGEAACRYHGANRLGGNSMLAALFGGRTAAESAAESAGDAAMTETQFDATLPSPSENAYIRDVLAGALGIVRTGEKLRRADAAMTGFMEGKSGLTRARAALALAMIRSAEARKESRGAHYRADYPAEDDGFRSMSVTYYDGKNVSVGFAPADEGE